MRKWKEVNDLIDSTQKFISPEMTFQDWLHYIFLEVSRDGDIFWYHIFILCNTKTCFLNSHVCYGGIYF